MRFRIQALLWIICVTSATAQVATNTISVDNNSWKSNHLILIVSGYTLDDKHLLDLGDFTILSAQPANF